MAVPSKYSGYASGSIFATVSVVEVPSFAAADAISNRRGRGQSRHKLKELLRARRVRSFLIIGPFVTDNYKSDLYKCIEGSCNCEGVNHFGSRPFDDAPPGGHPAKVTDRESAMNIEKFSERARGFIQAGQTIALRENNQRFLPEHLLKALLDDDQGLAQNLIRAAGGDPSLALAEVDGLLRKVPRIEGGGDQLYMDNATAKVLAEAEKLAKAAGDSFVTVERLLTALAMTKSGAADVLKASGVTAQALNAAINEIRKGRTADSASAEQGYDALKKYARDLTQAARDGKIDPIVGRDEERSGVALPPINRST